MKRSIAILIAALAMVGFASCLQRDPYYVGDRIYDRQPIAGTVL